MAINYQASFVTSAVDVSLCSYTTQLKQILKSAMAQDSVKHQKTKSPRGGRVNGWIAQWKWVTKVDSVQVQREWGSTGITGSYSMGQDVHTPLPCHPPCFLTLLRQETQALSGSEKPHGWPPSLTELMPVSQKLSETPADSWWTEPEHSSELLCQSFSTISLKLWRAPRASNTLAQASKGVVFSRVGSERFLSWPYHLVTVWPWASNLHFTA